VLWTRAPTCLATRSLSTPISRLGFLGTRWNETRGLFFFFSPFFLLFTLRLYIFIYHFRFLFILFCSGGLPFCCCLLLATLLSRRVDGWVVAWLLSCSHLPSSFSSSFLVPFSLLFFSMYLHSLLHYLGRTDLAGTQHGYGFWEAWMAGVVSLVSFIFGKDSLSVLRLITL
jgi:hypothetical protein